MSLVPLFPALTIHNDPDSSLLNYPTLVVGFVLGILATLGIQRIWALLVARGSEVPVEPPQILDADVANQTLLPELQGDVRYYLILRSQKHPALAGLHFGVHPRAWNFVKRQLKTAGTTDYHRVRDHAEAVITWQQHFPGTYMPHHEHA